MGACKTILLELQEINQQAINEELDYEYSLLEIPCDYKKNKELIFDPLNPSIK